jgi:alkyl hydroperoxide reductase subunit AhpF
MDKFLGADVEKQVREIFADLKEPVAVVFFGSKIQHCEYCKEIHQLLSEVVALSANLSLEAYDLEEDAAVAARFRVDKAPSFVLAARNGDLVEDTGVIFSGIPAQYEFTSLIQGLLMVSQRDSGLNPATRQFLAGLTEPVHLQVFITPT